MRSPPTHSLHGPCPPCISGGFLLGARSLKTPRPPTAWLTDWRRGELPTDRPTDVAAAGTLCTLWQLRRASAPASSSPVYIQRNARNERKKYATDASDATAETQACLCGSLAQCALSLKRLSAAPGVDPQTRQNKLFQDYWRACFEINFSDRQEGLTVSSIICDR